jgi:hypothetical protein
MSRTQADKREFREASTAVVVQEQRLAASEYSCDRQLLSNFTLRALLHFAHVLYCRCLLFCCCAYCCSLHHRPEAVATLEDINRLSDIMSDVAEMEAELAKAGFSLNAKTIELKGALKKTLSSPAMMEVSLGHCVALRCGAFVSSVVQLKVRQTISDVTVYSSTATTTLHESCVSSFSVSNSVAHVSTSTYLPIQL